MRAAHLANPFHKIQKWTGEYFRAAELWEVGCYILVPHRSGLKKCSALSFRVTELEKVQQRQDTDEQRQLEMSAPHIPAADRRMFDIEETVAEDGGGANEEAENAAIDALIDRLYAEHIEDGAGRNTTVGRVSRSSERLHCSDRLVTSEFGGSLVR